MELYLERDDCQKRPFRTASRTGNFEIVKANTKTMKIRFFGNLLNQGHPTTVCCKISVRRNKYCLEFSIAWERFKNSRWLFHSCAIFEAYVIISQRFSEFWFLTFHCPGKAIFRVKRKPDIFECKNVMETGIRKNSPFRNTLSSI